jgi:hypothetical protein
MAGAVGLASCARIVGRRHHDPGGPQPPLESSLTLALGIGLAFRVAVVALSYRHTPGDAAIVFRHSAELVRAGRNPVFAPEWSSTPLVPYLHAALLPVALPWQVVERVLPVLADLVTIVLVGRLAGHRAATARMLYATNPLALLVVAHHGQLECQGSDGDGGQPRRSSFSRRRGVPSRGLEDCLEGRPTLSSTALGQRGSQPWRMVGALGLEPTTGLE